ncbi:GntR family transcriptional regulator [Leifsonia shinshuensis]
MTAALRDAILASEYAPNQRLVAIDLSERYGVSRAAVRAAFLTLESEGLIEQLPNRGARVRAISIDEAIEIVEARIGLEVLVARRAAENLTPSTARELEELRDKIVTSVATGNLIEYSRLHQELDRALRVIGDHQTANELLERLAGQSARHQFRIGFVPDRARVSAVEHAAIIDAVLARDPDAAERATKVHLASVIDVLRRLEA